MTNKELKSTSQFLSMILRHKPEVIGISLDDHGWANVNDIVNGISKSRDFDFETLKKIVDTDDKKRYSFNDDMTLIRANQGHSVQVDVELEEKRPSFNLYHGTGEKYCESIEKIGLIPKSRLYVHLSSDIDTAIKVGSRHGKAIVYEIDTSEMIKDGYKFYISANMVWLTKEVPVKYIKRIK